jgi:hypothetical protein
VFKRGIIGAIARRILLHGNFRDRSLYKAQQQYDLNNDAACSRKGEYPQNIGFLQHDAQNVESLLISCRILF